MDYSSFLQMSEEFSLLAVMLILLVFDIFAGELKRAPKWMISLGLEWLYRVIKEPFRIKRLISIPKFLLLVLKNKSKVNNV